jgi:hypothetical protein
MADSLVDLLLAAAARDPDKVALRRQHAAWTYGDLTRGAAAASATCTRRYCSLHSPSCKRRVGEARQQGGRRDEDHLRITHRKGLMRR